MRGCRAQSGCYRPEAAKMVRSGFGVVLHMWSDPGVACSVVKGYELTVQEVSGQPLVVEAWNSTDVFYRVGMGQALELAYFLLFWEIQGGWGLLLRKTHWCPASKVAFEGTRINHSGILLYRDAVQRQSGDIRRPALDLYRTCFLRTRIPRRRLTALIELLNPYTVTHLRHLP